MKKTKEIKVGNIIIGGGNKIIIQSMTNTKTKNILDTVKQINNLEKSGCELVRVAVLDETDAYALKEIKKQINIPLVADIHFDYKLALIAIDMGIDKLRINPGNIGSIDKIKMVVEKCKEKNIPIRIGVNSGSLEKEIKETYGSSAVALVKSAERHVKILEDLNFKEIIISLKASNVKTTVEAYRLASKTFSYPLHLGVTEAGTITIGTIKSSVALGILLNEGIGDTIRVSLSSDPIDEIRVAKEILASLNLYQKPDLISCPTCGRTQYNMIPIVNEIEKFLDTLGNVSIKVAIMGCAVNGPGEAMDADLGIAGGVNSALLFKKGVIIKKIPQEDIIEELKKEILLMIK
ncbi:MAG: flavodoxin-dependent (E)-4-hydroxy-3-methylbut-2-enyl-diphosphate synthase [Bacilli bacterium]|jgi:(E)-4-hydroxy-3-methylbut-2-enyl-diphosphate synthase|nr:flavodoxin-dependent (E)-4-hydroxy-3-methylbut-2-enyl-diphosphate synthase [Bacilli bacterium]MDD2681782.1 flavodoxin-dependent (E)-4-hydroxy-3-methylbut-2-enyl-diphosphate synthase [Bacilli bacterium]MDD3121604.1 flavodoxin-dependent (E)-4-hydroxy-3-methylbut-2-enyl-diphosphate synthase [Bacilli bacterium]MDD4062963.1 flavodoxin-dependent (E)-4-hydroxy-3-methylbut-2-enyl-diphosphate synthase [Bacilli bacterium]MDD4482321.1 flavodoxin-dependent (E)-4-hydroxy-3-methylbut-2-enyl-diphosphate sy